jgi:hypothetical protein
VDYIGRIDFQVKLRGFRIELGEIEALLEKVSGVQRSVVLLREDRPGDAHLVAYVVAESPAPSTEDLRRSLGETLPEHMVPSFFVSLEALPLSSNGKVDRRALPAPQRERPSVPQSALPQSAREQLIAGIWRETLGLDEVGIHENFFELGGHSLKAAEVHHRLEEEIGGGLTLVDLFHHPTIYSLAHHLGAGEVEKESFDGVRDLARKEKEARRRRRRRQRKRVSHG